LSATIVFALDLFAVRMAAPPPVLPASEVVVIFICEASLIA